MSERPKSTTSVIVVAFLLLMLAPVSWKLSGVASAFAVAAIVVGVALVAYLTARLVAAARGDGS